MKKLVSTKKAAQGRTAKNSKNQEIRFYRSNEKPYGVFSNLFRRPIVFEDKEFATAEHAYQAGKPKRAEVQEWLLNAPTPSLVPMAAHGLYFILVPLMALVLSYLEIWPERAIGAVFGDPSRLWEYDPPGNSSSNRRLP